VTFSYGQLSINFQMHIGQNHIVGLSGDWQMLKNPAIQAEYERIERDEMPMLDTILNARREAGLTQAKVAERMGTKAPAVARLESALVSGKHSPSIETLKKYAAAMGKRVEVRFRLCCTNRVLRLL
jgi:DNA-binding XRE family transcriptional regulator